MRSTNEMLQGDIYVVLLMQVAGDSTLSANGQRRAQTSARNQFV
jgi:hypothetical protein